MPAFEEDDFYFQERGEIPESKCITILWGIDEPDGTRIDYYETFEGVFYKRTIPPGGGFVPLLTGTKPGLEPFWEQVPEVPPNPNPGTSRPLD